MKKILLFSLIILMAVVVSAQRYSDSTWIIGEGHIGKISINMVEQKLSSLFTAEQIKKEEKTDNDDIYSIINISLKGESKTALELETMCMDVCLISRISLYSDKYKTVKGIGIGSTMGDIKKNYSISAIRGGEKGIMVYVDDLPQTEFIMNVPKVRAIVDKVYKTMDIPDDSKIEMVSMY